MIRNTFIKTICLVALMGSLVSSCKKLLDVNTNPNKPSEVTLGVLLPSVLEATATNHYQVGFTANLLAQQLAAYTSGPLNDDQHRDVRMSTAFFTLYSNTLNNNVFLVKTANQQGAPVYEGIAKILLAMNLGMATDIWGNIPYSDAFKGAENLYPKYDKQQDIYTNIQTLLSEAIVLLQKPPGILKPTTEDLVFGGNTSRWIKTANVLKARYYMHLTKKGVANSATLALSFLAAGFAGNADDCQLVYNDRNFNPWYRNVAIGITTGNFVITHSKKFIDGMNGSTYPGLTDPRLPFIADKGAAATYSGIQNGVGTGGNTNITGNTYYAKINSPILMVTYAEQKFLEAEALFLTNGGTTVSTGATTAGYNAYLAGIGAHMDKVGVAAADKNTYIANAQVSTGEASLKLEFILREKFIATYLHPETWVDVRRYDYNPALYRGIGLPINQDPVMGGQTIQRAIYPLTEVVRNPSVTGELKPLTEKLWWNQ
jgi:Starch-binding associating with outer membrane